MRIRNAHKFPKLIVDAVSADLYDGPKHHETERISINTLFDAPQVRMLWQEHHEEVEVDVADRIWMLMGTAVHAVIEQAALASNPEDRASYGIVEERLSAMVDGWELSGKPDLIADGEIWDWKFVSVWSTRDGVKPSWVQAANGYRWLKAQLEGNVAPSGLKVGVIYRDWLESAAKREPKTYPSNAVEVFDIRPYPLEEVERVIRARVRLHQEAAAGNIPDCTSEERWARPDIWRVKARGRKVAVRGGVHYNEADAQRMAKSKGSDHYVEHTKGESKRCNPKYCPVVKWCPQAKRAVMTEIGSAL